MTFLPRKALSQNFSLIIGALDDATLIWINLKEILAPSSYDRNKKIRDFRTLIVIAATSDIPWAVEDCALSLL
jgi:hypothetical protein